MYAMLINNVAQVMDPVHVEGAFFQVGRIACVVAGCAEPVEYVASVLPKTCCK
jgi:hypothetical protein